MTKKITLQIVLFFALAAPMVGWAQTITGKVIDSDKTPLEFVSVAVINAADSTLVSYTTTDKNGAFKYDNYYIEKARNCEPFFIIKTKDYLVLYLLE